MKLIEQWVFPVPSNCIYNGVSLKYRKGDAVLLFDFFDEEDNDRVFSCGIIFISTVAHRHSSEKFTKYISGTYDKLVIIEDSKWVSELMAIGSEWANDINHYAIYLDSYGLYEFISQEHLVLDVKEGVLNEGGWDELSRT